MAAVASLIVPTAEPTIKGMLSFHYVVAKLIEFESQSWCKSKVSASIDRFLPSATSRIIGTLVKSWVSTLLKTYFDVTETIKGIYEGYSREWQDRWLYGDRKVSTLAGDRRQLTQHRAR